ncbi:MAG TPA: ribosome maturation factor RimP [Candidatus Cybelea sp.]|nr:ribosome maturation factor RimP [Candidatus Cybelea sp.]
MDAAARIEKLITPALQGLGLTLVRVQFSGGNRPVLQVMAERGDGSMTLDDCKEASRVISAILDVEDPIASAYTLEVSSPGIDRPLMRLADYGRFAGYEARVETRMPIEGRRRFRGKLLPPSAESIRIRTTEGEFAIPFADVQAGKLVLTDELIAASLKQQGN